MSTMFSQCMAVSLDRCLPVYYEQLVLQPREQLARVLRFLELHWIGWDSRCGYDVNVYYYC